MKQTIQGYTVEEMMAKARKLAKNYIRKSHYAEDILGAAYEGVAYAIAKFDTSRNSDFVGYLRRCIIGKIADELRRLDELTRRHRIAVKGGFCEVPEMVTLRDHYWVTGPEQERVAEQSMAADKVHNLRPRLREILRLIYDEQRQQFEIAKVFKVSPSRVNQLHARAIEKLRAVVN